MDGDLLLLIFTLGRSLVCGRENGLWMVLILPESCSFVLSRWKWLQSHCKTSSRNVQGCQKLYMCKSCGFSLNALWNLEGWKKNLIGVGRFQCFSQAVLLRTTAVGFTAKPSCYQKKTKRQKFRHCLNATVTGAEILQHQAHLKPLLGGVPQPLLRLCLLVVFSPWLCLGSDGCALDFSKSSFLSDLLWLLNNALIISLSFSPRLLWGAGLGRHVPLLHAASRSFSMAGAPSWGRAVRAVPGLGKPLGVILTG